MHMDREHPTHAQSELHRTESVRGALFDMEAPISDVLNLTRAAMVIATYGADQGLDQEDLSGLLTLLTVIHDRAEAVAEKRRAGLTARFESHGAGRCLRFG